MIASRAPRSLRHPAQRGYALLLVVFLMTVLLLSAMAVSPSILTNGRREKEDELIWRGNQYVRGIKLFYRRNNRFPTSLEDLTKPGVGNFRFMRQAYKDPLNKEDGSWRLLYVGAGGRLIGSLKPQQPLLQLPGAQAQGIAALGSLVQQSAASGTPPPSATTPGTQSGNAPADSSSTDASNPQNDPMLNPPADSGLGSSIIGGNIIGVASNVNQRSLRVYQKAKNYKLFEFYWDPAKDLANALQNGMQPGTFQNGAPGVPVGAPIGQPGGQQGNPKGSGGLQDPAPLPNPQQ